MLYIVDLFAFGSWIPLRRKAYVRLVGVVVLLLGAGPVRSDGGGSSSATQSAVSSGGSQESGSAAGGGGTSEAVPDGSENLDSPTAEASVTGEEGAPASDERTTLNLLGAVDANSGESRRNENVQITLIDNNVLNELNRRMGTTATIVREFEVERG